MADDHPNRCGRRELAPFGASVRRGSPDPADTPDREVSICGAPHIREKKFAIFFDSRQLIPRFVTRYAGRADPARHRARNHGSERRRDIVKKVTIYGWQVALCPRATHFKPTLRTKELRR